MIRICPERDAQCPNGMACREPCGSTHPLTPREKVEKAVERAVLRACNRTSGVKDMWLSSLICGEEIDQATDAILTALASGSGDHAELARLAEAATPGPWIRSGVRRKLGDEDCIMVGPDGFLIVALPIGARPQEHAGAFKDAAFIAAANPATVLALLAEIAALRDREKAALKECSEWARKAGEAIGRLETSEAAGIVEGWRDRTTEAERKLAEAVGLLEPFAKLAEEEGGYREDDRLAWGLNAADINWGDLRAARTFLSKEAERG